MSTNKLALRDVRSHELHTYGAHSLPRKCKDYSKDFGFCIRLVFRSLCRTNLLSLQINGAVQDKSFLACNTISTILHLFAAQIAGEQYQVH